MFWEWIIQGYFANRLKEKQGGKIEARVTMLDKRKPNQPIRGLA